MNTAQLRTYFEDHSLTEEHQNFVLRQTMRRGAIIQDGADTIVKFLLSDHFITTRVRIAKIIQQNPPEKASVLISQAMIDFSFGLMSELGDENDTDELGFQK